MGTTYLGGITQTFVNGTGAASIPGTIVKKSATDPTIIQIASSTDDDPIGVVFDSVAANTNCEVVVSGAAYVLLALNTPCARGQRIGVSTTEPGYGEYDSEPSWVGQAAESVPKPGAGNRCFVLANIEPAGISSSTMPDAEMTRTIYVDVNALDDGDGSMVSPLNSIQDAVDMADTMTPSASSPVLIKIGPGTYVENILIQTDYLILQGAGYNDTIISPSSGVGVCVSNATPASIAAFHAAGGGSASYALLAAQAPATAGVTSLQIMDLTVSCVGAAGNVPLELLGVPGDDTPATTNFLSVAFYIWNSTFTLQVGAVAPYMYVRNCNSVLFYWSGSGGAGSAGGTIFYNCAYAYAESTSLAGLNARYIAGDPQGEPSWGVISFDFTNCSMADQTFLGSQVASYVNCSVDDTSLSDTAGLTAWDSGMGNLDVNDTASVTTYGGYVEGTVDFEAGAIGVFYGTPMRQTLTIAAGAGTVAKVDSPVAGLITDAGNKLSYGGEDRYGYYDEAGGGGTRAIAFTPNFPNGASINVQITFESLGGGYQTGMVANGTLAHTGFSLTTSGNGRFYWHAHKVK